MGKGRNWMHQQNSETAVANEPLPPTPAPTPNTAFKGTESAGLGRIREAINLISTHSASSIGGSMLSEALKLLESAYDILGGNKPKP
jgi:hypothetical protein